MITKLPLAGLYVAVVGLEPVPFCNMFIIVSKLPDICFAIEDDIITEDVY